MQHRFNLKSLNLQVWREAGQRRIVVFVASFAWFGRAKVRGWFRVQGFGFLGSQLVYSEPVSSLACFPFREVSSVASNEELLGGA